jgi:hypothetical protein
MNTPFTQRIASLLETGSGEKERKRELKNRKKDEERWKDRREDK